VFLMPHGQQNSDAKRADDDNLRSEAVSEEVVQDDRGDVVALFRLLLREPPPEHDIKACTVCKRYGITSI